MNRSEFRRQLEQLAQYPVEGMDWEEKLVLIRRLLTEIEKNQGYD